MTRKDCSGLPTPSREGKLFDFCENPKENPECENLESKALNKTPEFCIRPRSFDKGSRVLFSTSISRGEGGNMR